VSERGLTIKGPKGGAAGGGSSSGTAGIVIAIVLGVLLIIGIVWVKKRGAKR
jgi:hypothetical protein